MILGRFSLRARRNRSTENYAGRGVSSVRVVQASRTDVHLLDGASNPFGAGSERVQNVTGQGPGRMQLVVGASAPKASREPLSWYP